MDIKNVVGKYRKGSWYQRQQKLITRIVVHHSAWKIDRRLSDETILSTIQGWHEAKDWPGLSYHFVITPNGNIYKCNDFEDITWHDTINNDSIGILVHGYFHPPENDKPTREQLTSLKELLDWLCTENPQFPAAQKDVVGHRDRSSTACPGDTLYEYVREYRDNNGSVSWADTSCEEALEKMTENKDEWKTECRKEREKRKKSEEAKDRAIKLAEEMEDREARMAGELGVLKNKVLTIEEEKSRLEMKIEALEAKNYTVSEALSLLAEAILNGRWKVNGKS